MGVYLVDKETSHLRALCSLTSISPFSASTTPCQTECGSIASESYVGRLGFRIALTSLHLG